MNVTIGFVTLKAFTNVKAYLSHFLITDVTQGSCLIVETYCPLQLNLNQHHYADTLHIIS